MIYVGRLLGQSGEKVCILTSFLQKFLGFGPIRTKNIPEMGPNNFRKGSGIGLLFYYYQVF